MSRIQMLKGPDLRTVEVLRAVDDLTASWLCDALGAPVRGFDVAATGTGQRSGTFRVSLDWDGEVNAVIVKLADADPSVRASCMSMGMYEREVSAYHEVAERPSVHGARTVLRRR